MAYEIFLIGATGYIGGAVLQALLARKDAAELAITVLLRNSEKVKGFEEIGVKSVIGSLSDADVLREQARKADLVINIGDCDDEPSIHAILQGLKQRKQDTGVAPSYFHTSGTGVFITHAGGNAPKDDDPIYDDNDPDQIESLPDSAWHRAVDLAIVAADKAGDCRSYIICPSTIYGEAPGDLGKGEWKGKLANTRSRQMPIACQLAIKRGQPGVVASGENVWPHVQINDLIPLYMLIFDLAKKQEGAHGREGYYNAENGHYQNIKVASYIGAAMKKQGISQNSEPKSYSDQELEDIVGRAMVPIVGSACRVKSTRSRSIGWTPKYTTEDFYNALEEEVAAQNDMLKKTGGKGVQKW